jgi:hypothetical protein
MNHNLKHVGLLCGLALMTAGCVQRAPFLESQMGQSLSLIKAQQTWSRPCIPVPPALVNQSLFLSESAWRQVL